MECLVLGQFRKYIIYPCKLQSGNVENGKITSCLIRPHFNVKVMEIIDVSTKPETNLGHRRTFQK